MEKGGWIYESRSQKINQFQATLVFGQMNESPGSRARVALSGLTLAEYYREGEEMLDVYLILYRQHFPFHPSRL